MRHLSTVSLIALAGALMGCGKDSTGPDTFTVLGCNAGQRLTIGQSGSGSLSASDCLDPGDFARADYYEFNLTAAGPVSITVQTPSGSLIAALIDRNEDILDFVNARPGNPAIVGGNLPAGRYVLVIAGTQENQTSTYTFTSSRTLPPPPPAFFGCSVSQSYTIGTTLTGALATTDCSAPSGAFLDRYDFTVAATRAVTIDLQSSTLDAFLYLFNSSGALIAENDDTGASFNSSITITLAPGSYSIGASSFDPGVSGSYTLSSR